MSSLFADTHNVVAILEKSDAAEGFEQIIDFLSDVTRLQALVDKKKIVIYEVVIREILQLDDAEGVVCLPNEEIFAGLAQMGYEKPSTKQTFYKAFFSSQWKFLIHTILQSLSTKRTSWNEFSTAMGSAVICLSKGQKFNFSKYIFDNLVRNVDSSSKFYMVGKGFSGVETPLFEGMLADRQPAEEELVDEQVQVDDAVAVTVEENVAEDVAHDAIPSPPSHDIPSPSPEPSSPPQQPQSSPQAPSQEAGNYQAEGNEIYHIDLDHSFKVLSMQEDDSKVQEVVEVVTTTKFITDVVTAAASQVSAVSAIIPASKPKEELSSKTLAETPAENPKVKDKGKGILVKTSKPMKKKDQIELDAEYVRKLHEEINRDHEGFNKDIDWDAAMDHVNQKSNNPQYIKRYQGIKKRPQTESESHKNMMIYLKNTAGYKMDLFKGMTYAQICPIFQARFDENMRFLFKLREEMEWKLSEEAQEAKDHRKRLEVVDDEDDDVFVEATPLARKVRVMDYQIVLVDNKLRFKIIKADETHQLYISFTTLLKNFDREYLKSLWRIVKDRFSTSKPTNFSNEYLLLTLKRMFEKPNEQDAIWRNQKSVHGLALSIAAEELMLPSESKFDGKADEGFFVGYSTNSKAFRIFNSRTRIVEENLHVKFSENTPNIAGSGPNWLFDINALTKSMNYKPVVAGNHSNGSLGTKACDIVGKSRVKTVPDKDYILLPLWTQDPLFSSSLKDSPGAGYKPLREEEKKDAEDPGNEDNEAPINAVGRKLSIKLPDDPNMPELEDISIFEDSNEDVFGAEADLHYLEYTFSAQNGNKLDERGIVTRNKERLVDQVHTQEEGLMVYQMDVKSAFLYEKLEKRKEMFTEFEKKMHKKFQISSMEELTFFLGLQVKQKEDGIFIHWYKNW
nr:ribonuclease H-like domain-containing protein [Tanacetum cinerariifolium]